MLWLINYQVVYHFLLGSVKHEKKEKKKETHQTILTASKTTDSFRIVNFNSIIGKRKFQHSNLHFVRY